MRLGTVAKKLFATECSAPSTFVSKIRLNSATCACFSARTTVAIRCVSTRNNNNAISFKTTPRPRESAHCGLRLTGVRHSVNVHQFRVVRSLFKFPIEFFIIIWRVRKLLWFKNSLRRKSHRRRRNRPTPLPQRVLVHAQTRSLISIIL